jgi:hypothetical protein
MEKEMIVEFDGEGEAWREKRLISAFCTISEDCRVKIRKMKDHEGHLSVYAENADAVLCAEVQLAWELEHECSFDVFNVKSAGKFSLIYTTQG